MRPLTVLLTGCGAPGGPGIIKCLRKNGERDIRIVGVDMNETAGGRRLVDAFYPVPPASSPDFISRVLEICRKEAVHIVLPLVTKELEKFSAAKPLFESSGVKVAVMDPEPLHIANNKGLLLTAMQEAGMPTPEFRVVHTADEVAAAISDLGYPRRPVVVKPTFGNGGRGTRILDTSISRYELFFNNKPNSMVMGYDELMQILQERDSIPEMMVMEYLPGDEYSVDVLAWQGQVDHALCRRGTLMEHGNQLDCVVIKHERLVQLANEMCALLDLSGNACFDIKEDAAGNIQIMEMNPRLSAGIVSFAAAGVNLPYLGIKRLLGEELPTCQITEGVIMQRRYEEIFLSPDGQKIDW